MAKRKNHLPKRIGGVKIPKHIRRGVLGQFLASPAGQAVIAARSSGSATGSRRS